MKTYVLLVAENFPKNHPRAGQATNFYIGIKRLNKLHTIRFNYELWQRRFIEINAGRACLSVRSWVGLPYRSSQREIFRFDNTDEIGLEKLEFEKSEPLIESTLPVSLATLSKNDHLSETDFREWFGTTIHTNPKPLAVIHFTKFRYAS